MSERLTAEQLSMLKADKNTNPITFYPRTGDEYLPHPTIYDLKEGNLKDAEFHSLKESGLLYVFSRRPSSTPLAEWMDTTHFDELHGICPWESTF
ncbi:hypothetical protein CEXT_169471 [Caerostris extrusa]|uniref:Uncharacterized protein n=1 Tax=Caerostris extrusa TaxID=172846 RepID=A0AAV4V1L3_CAEEX|nr:hypothetical protein CEXT_169471 [Caerostris extrusa]